MHFKTSPHTSLDHVKCTRAHTHIDSCKHIHTVYAHTHRTQLQRIVGAEKSRGLMGSYGRWQNVLHAQTNGVWQLPLRKTCGCFLFFSSFFIFYYCLTDCFSLFVYLCSALQMTSHPWRATSFSFAPSFLSFFHPVCFLPFFFASFLFKSFSFFSHRDKWILNWHGVGLSPIEVHIVL